MVYLFLLILAILPSFLLGSYVYKKDVVEKEPKKLLVKLFLLGIFIIIPVFIIEIVLEEFGLGITNNQTIFEIFISSLFGIALIEEGAKWFVTYKTSWSNDNFTHVYDGIVYSVFVSLGFATFENILYVMIGGAGVAIIRAVLSVPGHMFFGVFMGYYLGLAKLTSENGNHSQSRKYKLLSFVMPIILHGIFDFCLLSQEGVLILIYIAFIIILYIVSFRRIKQLSRVMTNIKAPAPYQYNDYKLTLSKETDSQLEYCPYCKEKVIGTYCTNCGKKLK